MGQRKQVLTYPQGTQVTASGDCLGQTGPKPNNLASDFTPDGLAYVEGLQVNAQDTLLILVNLSAMTGTTPSIQFLIDTLGEDGVWYSIANSGAAFTSAPKQWVFTLAGQNSQSQEFGDRVRLRWVTTGTASPTFTFSASIIGK